MTDEDLYARLHAYWGVTTHPMPTFHPIDRYVEKDGRLIGWLEAKTRNVPHDHYPTALVDAAKWHACITHEDIHAGTKAYLAYGWSDGTLGVIRPAHYHEPLTTGLATPGEDTVSLNAGHRRPVVYIPIHAFTIVGGS